MSEVLPLAKYGIYILLAAIPPLDAFVFGTMAVSLGVSDKPYLAIIQGIAVAAIVYSLAKESFLRGIAAALGAIGSAVITLNVTDIFLQAFGQFFGTVVTSLIDMALKGLFLGIAAGVALALSPLSLLSIITGFILALLVQIVMRAIDLIESALEIVTHALFKGMPVGVMALLAPYYGGIVIALPLAFAIVIFLTLVAIAIGIAIGIAIVAIVLSWTVVFTILGFVSLLLFIAGVSLAALLKPVKASLMSPLIDTLVLLIFPYLGPALYTSGYAGLLTRKRALGLYLIGLGLFGAVLPIKLPF
ncbi:hypothetical protein QIT50_gp09 [Pyrobaculum spherical virus 2]|uniref:Uncharacterized protein n=1 Tax=Pyrobaculum spherical virus 2 TaxID=2730632 RepID=A0A6M3VYU1_9VIRU|nr:hypothetical protein QIT50_gp09 [Pyrobaculum spherical virus 2]QJF12421.1 hypothetical protein PSV2_gp09 [Pyrobaculum spherical virus 2]